MATDLPREGIFVWLNKKNLLCLCILTFVKLLKKSLCYDKIKCNIVFYKAQGQQKRLFRQ